MIAALALLAGCEGGGVFGVVPSAPPEGTDPTPVAPPTDPPAPDPTEPETEPVPLDPLFLAWFDPNVLHVVDLALPAEVWAGLRDDEVEATLTIDGLVLPGVGVALSGPEAEFGWGTKMDLELDLDAFGGVRTADLVSLELDGLQDDPAQAREVVSGQLLRAAGVPVQWSAFAEVRVNGELLGLYTLREPVDDEFPRKRWHLSDGGLWESEEYADFTAEGLEAFDRVAGDPSTDALVATRLAIESDTFWSALGAAANPEQILGTWAFLDILASNAGYPHTLGNAWWYADPLDGGRLSLVPGPQDTSWYSLFAPDEVDGAVGTACLADVDCAAALAEARVAAVASWPSLGALEVLGAAFTLTADAVAADPNRASTVTAVNNARSTLHQGMDSWPFALVEP